VKRDAMCDDDADRLRQSSAFIEEEKYLIGQEGSCVVNVRGGRK